METEIVEYREHTVTITYLDKSILGPRFGQACGDKVSIRSDLSVRVKRFVRAHELFHVADESTWWGVFGREIRANFFPALSDPIGFFACVYATLTNKERVLFYVDRIRKGY